MEQRISKLAYFLLASVASLALVFNIIIWQSSVIGVLFGLAYLLFCSFIFGSVFFKKIGWQLLYGFILLLSLIAVWGAASIYFYRFNDFSAIALILLLPAVLLLPYYYYAQPKKKFSLKNLIKDYWEKFTERQEPKTNLLLVALYLLLAAGCFFLLLHGRTVESIQTPWQTVKTIFIPLYFLATAILLTYFLRSTRTKLPLLLLSLHAFLSCSVALLVYKIGYGYDPFIHEATEKIISQTGTITPKPLYYLGQYALVIFFYKLSFLDLSLIDKILVPVLFSLALPATVYFVFHHWMQKNFALALSLAILVVPYAKFIMTAPQNLANLFFILTVLLSLLYFRNSFSLPVLLILAAATLSIHLLAGIPLLITLFLLVLFKWLYHSYSRYLTLYLLPALVFTFFLPLAFLAKGSQIIPAWPDLKKADFLWLYWVDKYDLPLNLAYLVYLNKNVLAAVIILIGLIYLAKHKLLKNNAGYLMAAFVIFSNFYISKYFLTFPELRDYDKNDFVSRLALLAFYVLLPFFLLGLYWLIKRLWRDNFYSKGLLIFTLSGALTVSFYFSYPRLDQYEQSKFFSVSVSDLKAVNFIEQSAQPDHIVLANQMVGAAAISELGFKKYYQDQFYYSLPMGAMQTFYEGYLAMVYQGAKRETMENVMAQAQVSESYFVINNYWRDFEKIVSQATKSADTVYNIDQGKIYIFKYTAKD